MSSTDDNSTEKTKGVGISTLSAPHKRNELNTFTLFFSFFKKDILSKEQFIEKLNEIKFYGTVPEKTTYWNNYESKEEAKLRASDMKTFISSEKKSSKTKTKKSSKETKPEEVEESSETEEVEESSEPEKVEESFEPEKVEESSEPEKVEEVPKPKKKGGKKKKTDISSTEA